MKISLINIFLSLSIVFTFSAGVIAFVNYQKYTAKTEAIMKANDLLLETIVLRSLIKDAETSQRGYLLTGKIEYLKPYLNFTKKISKEKQKALKLAEQNEIFKEGMAKLIDLIDKKHAELSYTIELKNTKGMGASLNIVNSDLGKILMDSIRIEVSDIITKENQLLQDLNAEFGSLMRFSNNIIYFFQVFVISMTIIAMVLLAKSNKQNESLVNELNTLNESLEKKVDERTKELYLLNQELSTQNEEILSQTEQIGSQNEQLIKLDEEKNKFIGIASHDLKSPINRIYGLIGIMKMHPEANIGFYSEYFGMMEKTIKNMLQLLKNLLDVNKLDWDKRDITIDKVDMNWIVKSISQIFEEQATLKDIKIRYVIPEYKIEIDSDESILMQIMENLVSNAIKFTENGKRVAIVLSQTGDEIRLEIQDQGVGIHESEMHLLFGKFQRLSTKPTGGEDSSGLGLFIAKELVERIGGKISCKSRIGEGSTFSVELPLKNVS